MAVCYLVGFMGCGKTTIGKKLADKLQLPFYDSDEEIEKNEGKTIDWIFTNKGEAYFRELEYKTIQELSNKNAVISVGGGAFIKEKNKLLMLNSAPVIYLFHTFETLYDRIKDTNRPLVLNNSYDQLNQLFSKRQPIYEEAKIIIDATNKTGCEVTDEVFRRLEKI